MEDVKLGLSEPATHVNHALGGRPGERVDSEKTDALPHLTKPRTGFRVTAHNEQ